jgi:hypothetical protein
LDSCDFVKILNHLLGPISRVKKLGLKCTNFSGYTKSMTGSKEVRASILPAYFIKYARIRENQHHSPVQEVWGTV